MKIKRTLSGIFAILLLASICSAGELKIKIVPSQERTSIAAFEEDNLDIVLQDGDKVLHKEYLYSSYGMAKAQLLKDAKGRQYALVRHGKGRGTHVREEFLTVYKVGRRLNQLVTFPINGPSGMHGDWEYKYRIDKPKAGGLKFYLTLELREKEKDSVFPEDKKRIITIE
jgi:hypothetical protein